MLLIVVGTIAIATVALLVYLRRERLGTAGIGMAVLRTVGMGALLLLLVNPVTTVRGPRPPPTVLLDASLSMGAAGGVWTRALDTARTLAGSNGSILRFGVAPAAFDTAPPTEGASRVEQALAAAQGGGPVYVVTDGELDDWAAVPPTLRLGVTLVVLPRDTLADAALQDVTVPGNVRVGDSIPLALTIATWGPLAADSGRVEVVSEGRRLAARTIALPPAPGTARRTLRVPAGALRAGEHVLNVRLTVTGDPDAGTHERQRVVRVAGQPSVIVLADPVDWEGRFLARALTDVVPSGATAFARIGPDRWIDMDRQEPVSASAIRAARNAAAAVVVRGPAALASSVAGPVWWWPSDSDASAGDWYVTQPVPSSPLADRLAPHDWDRLPPLTGLAAAPQTGTAWVALAARQGRRGPQRPVLVGGDSAGARRLTMLGRGAWRWALRGGAELDAYRTLVAGGVDWLLASEAVGRSVPLVAPSVVQRGVPVPFRWRGATMPDSLVVGFTVGDSSFSRTLRFDAAGHGLVALPPGAYRWRALGVEASGLVVVETYSDELHPRAVIAERGAVGAGGPTSERPVRRHWWLFVLVIAALAGEWAWRQRKGLA